MATQIFEYNVSMTCEGCSNAVNRVLSRLDGVNKIDIDMEKQRVYVETTSLSSDDVLGALKKTGRETSYIGIKQQQQQQQ